MFFDLFFPCVTVKRGSVLTKIDPVHRNLSYAYFSESTGPPWALLFIELLANRYATYNTQGALRDASSNAWGTGEDTLI